MTGILERAVEALARSGARWCRLWPEKAETNAVEVDLLIAPADVGAADRALQQVGFIPLKDWGYPSHRYYISHDQAHDRWTEFDIVTDLRFGRDRAIRLDEARECLDRRGQNGRWSVPSGDDGFWILLLHALLDKKSFPGRHGASLRDLAEVARADGPLGVRVSRASPRRWDADRMVRGAANQDWEELSLLVEPLRRRFTIHDPHGVFARALGHRFGRLLRSIRASPATASAAAEVRARFAEHTSDS